MYVCCYFFFFKQKTAYEMRISDWSSDVCSSDLHRKSRPMPKAAAPGSRPSIPAPTASAQRRQTHPVTRSLLPWPHPPNREPLIPTSLNLGLPPVHQALRALVFRLMVAAPFG